MRSIHHRSKRIRHRATVLGVQMEMNKVGRATISGSYASSEDRQVRDVTTSNPATERATAAKRGLSQRINNLDDQPARSVVSASDNRMAQQKAPWLQSPNPRKSACGFCFQMGQQLFQRTSTGSFSGSIAEAKLILTRFSQRLKSDWWVAGARAMPNSSPRWKPR